MAALLLNAMATARRRRRALTSRHEAANRWKAALFGRGRRATVRTGSSLLRGRALRLVFSLILLQQATAAGFSGARATSAADLCTTKALERTASVRQAALTTYRNLASQLASNLASNLATISRVAAYVHAHALETLQQLAHQSQPLATQAWAWALQAVAALRTYAATAHAWAIRISRALLRHGAKALARAIRAAARAQTWLRPAASHTLAWAAKTGPALLPPTAKVLSWGGEAVLAWAVQRLLRRRLVQRRRAPIAPGSAPDGEGRACCSDPDHCSLCHPGSVQGAGSAVQGAGSGPGSLAGQLLLSLSSSVDLAVLADRLPSLTRLEALVLLLAAIASAWLALRCCTAAGRSRWRSLSYGGRPRAWYGWPWSYRQKSAPTGGLEATPTSATLGAGYRVQEEDADLSGRAAGLATAPSALADNPASGVALKEVDMARGE